MDQASKRKVDMNRYDYLKSRIGCGRGVPVNRETVYRSNGFANGSSSKTYRGGEAMRDASGERVRGGKIAHNTYAYESGDTIIVRYHTTDILQAYPDGIVVALSGHCSFTTRQRHKEYMAPGWNTGNERGDTFVYGPRLRFLVSSELSGTRPGFLFPFDSGIITGFDLSILPAEFMVGIRVGDTIASDALERVFASQSEKDLARKDAWLAMASVTRGCRGKHFGRDRREYKRLYESLDMPEANGLWLAHRESGALERPLLKKDSLFGRVENSRLSLGNETWDLVDGFEYSAKGLS